MRVELREVEDVADEPLEPLRLGLHRRERHVAQLGILDDALEQRRDVAADRGQRRAQLVRDAHQEVALDRSASASRLAISPNRSARCASSPGAFVGTLDGVVARRDLVGSLRELEHRPDDPPREVDAEAAGHKEAEQRRERRAGRAARSTRWRTSVFGVATTIAPIEFGPMRTGLATAR